jgi:hypothetical protein
MGNIIEMLSKHIGDSVAYVPHHLQIDDMSKFNWNTPGIEYGWIFCLNETVVFVKYVRNGIPQNTAAATNPGDLFFLDGKPIIP